MQTAVMAHPQHEAPRLPSSSEESLRTSVLAGSSKIPAPPTTTHCYSPDVLAFFFFCLVAGSSALFKLSLFSGMRIIDKSKVGFIGGVLAAGYGLSAAF